MLAVRLRGAWLHDARSIDSNRLYAVICVIAYFVTRRGQGGSRGCRSRSQDRSRHGKYWARLTSFAGVSLFLPKQATKPTLMQ